MTIKAKPLVSSALLARGFGGRGTDFEIYTAAAVADEDTDLPIVRMVGSSTVKDLQGDIMTLTALQDMANGNPDLVIFLNHSYDIPDDVFGRLHGKPEIRMAGNIADLHLASIADLSRDEPGRYPRSKAYDTYTQIKKGKIRLGSSVGCCVTQYQFLDPDDFFSGILIEHVVWVEHSIVGVPASQRAWVEQAVKGLFERSLVEGNADEARRLAPAMKSLWDGPYDTILREIESEGLRRDLTRVKARGTASQRILFDFTQNGFVLAGPKNVKKSLAIEEVDALLAKSPIVSNRAEAIDNDDLDSTKAASGKTSWPLMDIGTEWTGSKAEKQIFDWARNDQDEIVASKARQCFLYYDAENSDTQKGYKMPFCYISDGSPKIVPLGVRACAGVLSGGMGGVSASAEDQDGMKAKVKTMYGRINRELHPDPEWEVPWEKKEDSADPELVKEYVDLPTSNASTSVTTISVQLDGATIARALSSAGVIRSGVADSESDAAINRQDLGEVTVGADGTHEPMTGKHSHRHTNGQGGDHEHEHSHGGDADHGHSHTEKAAGVAGCGCCSNCTGKSGCTCCDACTMQKTIGLDEDGNHAHKHEEKSSALTQIDTSLQLAYLSMYNEIGKKLGFPEHTLTTKCDLVPADSDATIVRTMLASLDDVSDALMGLAQRNDYYVDALMGMMGVPDVNDADEDDSSSDGTSSPMSMLYSLSPDDKEALKERINREIKSGNTSRFIIKEGRELSSKNRDHLQIIHDAVVAMHPDACKGVTGDGTAHQDGSLTVEEAQEEARQMGQGDSYSNLSSLMAETTKAILLKTFEGVSAKALVDAHVQKAVDAAIADSRANLELLQREQMALMQHISKLANMPLGRPTNLQRSVSPVSAHALENVATYEEMLSVAGIEGPKTTLAEVLAQTSIVEVPITRNGEVIRTKYRRWPAGVGGSVGEGVRPPLSSSQKTLMHYLDWGTYNSASGTVDVPLVDDPAERI